MLNPLKIDNAIRVYEKGRDLGMDEEEMKKALEIYEELRKHFSPEVLENLPAFIEKSYLVILSPGKRNLYLSSRNVITEALQLEGATHKPVYHSSVVKKKKEGKPAPALKIGYLSIVPMKAKYGFAPELEL